MITEQMKVEILPDKAALGIKAGEHGATVIREAIEQRGHANIIVATGASQFDTISALVASTGIDWTRVTAFHLDEYVGMPITHPASFRQYLWKRFVSQLPLPLSAFYYVNGDALNAQAECDRLGGIIQSHPIDLAFVGIGENGHLAFNDPPADFETIKPFIVVNLDDDCRRQQLGEGWFSDLAAVPKQAISMSIQHIMRSKAIICSVPDARKAKAVQLTIHSAVSPAAPASILQQHPSCTLYLDDKSASMI